MSPNPLQPPEPQPYHAAYGQALEAPDPKHSEHAQHQARDAFGRWIPGSGGRPKHTQSPTEAVEHTLETVQYGLAQAIKPGDSPKKSSLEAMATLEHLYPKTPVWNAKYAGTYHAIADLGTRFVDVKTDASGSTTVEVHDSIPKELYPQHSPME